MTQERIRKIVTDIFAKTFDPVFMARLEEFMVSYRNSLLEQYDWYKEFGYHAIVEGKTKPTFNLLPLEELTINTICKHLEEEQKRNENKTN